MEKHSIENWFQDFESDVTNFLVYFTGTVEVEDLVQDTFYIALQKLSKYKEDSHPKTWLIAIARNLVIDRYRRNQVWERIKYYLTTEQSLKNDIENSLIKSFEYSLLSKAIQQLSPPYKEVVILRGIMEMSPKEVSTVLRCSQNKVNVIYHRALKKIKVKLEAEGFHYEV
ncbi:RNA polymerase sigma factor [Ornithinibacillus scapharcae]|uniref:RNA polymerase sigma factor n=1 Tax=Ornithinibacillus scapharcae TaxID=1147159 RepID=UPI000225B5EC|nr:RNA polymerase sigma factor [Ornithinibacillus scapharcae]